jgi:Saxitoxin biosynthesis operon protein SxtJ
MKVDTHHEGFSAPVEVPGSSDRSFGFVFAGFFLLVSLWPLIRGGAIRPWAMLLAGGFLAAAFLRPSVLRPLNRVWTYVGILLHRIVSPLVLGMLFFVTITPIGLLMRWTGRIPLKLRFDPDAPSYWTERRPPGPPPGTMPNQF